MGTYNKNDGLINSELSLLQRHDTGALGDGLVLRNDDGSIMSVRSSDGVLQTLQAKDPAPAQLDSLVTLRYLNQELEARELFLTNRVHTSLVDFQYADINDVAANYPAGQRGDTPGSFLWPAIGAPNAPWNAADYFVPFEADATLPANAIVTEVLVHVLQEFNGNALASGTFFAAGTVAVANPGPPPTGYDTYMGFVDNALYDLSSVPAVFVKRGWDTQASPVKVRWNFMVRNGTASGGALTKGIAQMVVKFVLNPLR